MLAYPDENALSLSGPGSTPTDKPLYEPPQVTTYLEADILEQLGPAQAGGTYNLMGGV